VRLIPRMKMSTKLVTGLMVGIFVIIIIFQAWAAIMPEAQTAGDSMNNSVACTAAGGFYNVSEVDCQVNTTNVTSIDYSPIPLGGLFSGTGIVFIIIMAALIIWVVKGAMPPKK